MKYLHHILIEILWHLGLIHVPEWDNTPSPWVIREKKEKAKPRPRAAIEKDVVALNYGGLPEPGQMQKKIRLVIKELEEGVGWSFTRYDGKGNTPDYSNWNWADEEIINFLGFTDHQREMYILVRPDVLAGDKNREVAAKNGKSIRWADTYCAAVRAMCRLMDKEVESHSPTGEEGEEPEEAPQTPQGEGFSLRESITYEF